MSALNPLLAHILALFVCSALPAWASAERIVLPSEATQLGYVAAAIPLPDGGYRLVESDGAKGWVMTFDANDILVGRVRSRILFGGAEQASGRIVAAGFGRLDGVNSVGRDRQCRGELHGDGLRIQGLVYYGFNGLDGEGGAFLPSPVGVYAQGGDIHRFRADCVAESIEAAVPDDVSAVLNDPSAAAAYVITGALQDTGEAQRVDRRGTLWKRPAALFGPGELAAVAVLEDGSLLLHSSGAKEGDGTWSLLQANGRLRWQRVETLHGARLGNLLGESGSLFFGEVIPAPGMPPEGGIVALDADTGLTASRWRLPEGVATEAIPSLRNDGSLLFEVRIEPAAPSAAGERVLYEIGPDREPMERLRFGGFDDKRALAELRDGSVLVRGGDGVVRHHVDGRESGPGLAALNPKPVRLHDLVVGRDGSAYVVDDAGGLRISRVGPGGVEWSVPVLELFAFHPIPWQLVVDEALACLHWSPGGARPEQYITCLDVATGSQRFSEVELGPLGRLYSDGSIRRIEIEPSGENRLRYVRSTATPAGFEDALVLGEFTGPMIAVPHDAGNLLVFDSATASLTAFDPDGATAWSRTIELPPGIAMPWQLFAAPDGGALVGFTSSGGTWQRIGPVGELRWTRDSHCPGATVHPLGQDWLEACVSPVREGEPVRHQWARVHDGDGSTAWRTDRIHPIQTFLQSASNDGEYFLAAPHSAYGDSSIHAGADGRAIEPIPTSAGVSERFPYESARRLGFTNDDGIFFVAWTEIDAEGSRIAVERRTVPRAQETPSGSPSNGIWYAPASTGQGLHLVRTGPDTFAGNWLTFGSAPGNDPANQRWFAIFGRTTAPGVLELSMSAPAGHPQLPPGTLRAVGSATWRQTGCDGAVFDYRFGDPASGLEGVEGAIALQRLVPASACEGGDSRDALFVSRSGERVTLHIGADGTVAGYWPTFLPDSDYPPPPQWFALVGAADSLSIMRTLGGTFAAEPTSNTWRLGEARLVEVSCMRLRLEYRFDDSDVARPFAGRSGVMDLSRVGECPGGVD